MWFMFTKELDIRLKRYLRVQRHRIIYSIWRSFRLAVWIFAIFYINLTKISILQSTSCALYWHFIFNFWTLHIAPSLRIFRELFVFFLMFSCFMWFDHFIFHLSIFLLFFIILSSLSHFLISFYKKNFIIV
jgi:hypothetical protein